ncbi:nuclear transport factor 2 family protein [Mycolicibacterium sp. ELW1]|uniref:nuclear transport factor 2 family protein n=1 Tax=Mycobacteriaceae TaxID=1762 RepID=UPI0011ED4B6C|nr:nuclear transport factor 2 family protein [Mycobacterium sp. ELW1]QEN16450.1 nuclear transport factor 2 family protein [Mycobacterium sp. ELW1]
MNAQDSGWLRKYYADWDSGDIDAITSWFADDVVLEDVPTGHVARGAQEARSFVNGALKMAPGASYEVISVLSEGDRFAVEWVMQPAGLHGASIGTVRNGKVATNRDFWDSSPSKQ